MSTIKVNSVQPYTGTNVGVTGSLSVSGVISGDGSGLTNVPGGGGVDLIPLNNTWTGTNNFNNSVSLNQGANLPYDNGVKQLNVGLSGSTQATLGGFDYDGKAYGSFNTNGSGGFNLQDNFAGTGSQIYMNSQNGNINISGKTGISHNSDSGININGKTAVVLYSESGSIYLDGINTYVKSNNVSLTPKTDGASNFLRVGSNRINIFHSTFSNRVGYYQAGEDITGEIITNVYDSAGTYDNLLKIKTDSSGSSFTDYTLPSFDEVEWLQVPQEGTPSFKRGLEVTGSLATSVDVSVGTQLILTDYTNLDFADDAAAATGGVPLGGIYRTSGDMKIRIT